MILLIAVETLILILAACAASNYKVYASLSIGQLAKKHRIVCSVAAYLGLGVIMMIVMTVVGHILDGDVFDFIFDTVNGWFSGMEVTSIVAWVIFAAILAQVILVAIYHVISEQILRRKLNLE